MVQKIIKDFFLSNYDVNVNDCNIINVITIVHEDIFHRGDNKVCAKSLAELAFSSPSRPRGLAALILQQPKTWLRLVEAEDSLNVPSQFENLD